MRCPVLSALVLLCFLAGCTKDVEPAPLPPPSPPSPAPQAEPQPAAQPVPPPPPPAPRTLAERINETCAKLAAALAEPLGKDATVAVLPLSDEKGGVRRIGVVIGEGIEAALAARGVKVADRKHVQRVLDEQAMQAAMGAAAPAAGDLRKAGELAGAGVLVVGRITDAGADTLISAKALDVSRPGETLAATGLLSLPGEQLGRLMWYVQRPAEAASGELPPLAVKQEYIAAAAGGGETRLEEGATVHSGQRFKVRVQPNSDCCLYVLLYDSRGTASVLFPHEKIGVPNKVRGGVSYELPEGSKWYWFDRNTGTEQFYLVASYEPLDDLDEILSRMQAAGGNTAQLSAAAREQIDTVIAKGMTEGTAAPYSPRGFQIAKGVGGVVDVGWGQNASGDAHAVDDIVIGHATVVKKLTVQHR